MLLQLTSIYLPAFAIAFSPQPVIAITALCVENRERSGGTAFVMGWVISIIGFMAFSIWFLNDFQRQNPEDVKFFGVVIHLMLAGLLFYLSARNWVKRPRQISDIAPPNWLPKIKACSEKQLFWRGFGMNFANLKNIPVMIASAFTIARVSDSAHTGMLRALLFTLIASAPVLTPWLMALLGRDPTRRSLKRIRNWLFRENNIIMAVLFLILGINALLTGLEQLQILISVN